MKKLNFVKTQPSSSSQIQGLTSGSLNSKYRDLLSRINVIPDVSSLKIENTIQKNKYPFRIKTFHINDDDRGKILTTCNEGIIRDYFDHDKQIKKVKYLDLIGKLLTRRVLYIGSECEKMGKIKVTKEYNLISKKLSDHFVTINKVTRPTMSEIISKWDSIKPAVILISCHGDEMGLFLEDENGQCCHCRNSDFIKFFRRRSNYTECVILSSCESLNLGESISNEGKKVICINKKVDINTTIEFNRYFFSYINSHSLEDSCLYKNAFDHSMEIIAFEGLKDAWSFNFIDANKFS